jgi:fructosamine-3-kinase
VRADWLAWTVRQVMQRLQESEVWRDLIFSPIREQGPRLLHGDLWLGNMACDDDRRAHVVAPASWFGPADFDLSVGKTFGMPERFLQAYHHYCPPLEGSKERDMVYRLYVLLNHLNQPASYQYSSNVQREPLSVPV